MICAKIATFVVAICAAGATTGCYDDFAFEDANAGTDDYGAGVYADGDYPSDAFIASAEPYYYEGRPAYFYHNRWFYRDGGRWGHYQTEPPTLARFRAQARVNGTTRRYSPGHSSGHSGGGHGGGGHGGHR